MKGYTENENINNQDASSVSALAEKTASESLLNLYHATGEYNIDISSSYNYGKYYSDNQEFYFKYDLSDGYVNVYATIKLKSNELIKNFEENEFNIKYNHALEYEGEKYNIVLKLNSIRKSVNGEEEIYFQIARYKNEANLSAMQIGGMERINCNPGVGASALENGHTEIDVTFKVQDDNGNDVDVSGLFKLSDIDLNQGIAVDSLSGEIYMPEDIEGSGKGTDTIWYYGIDITSGASPLAAKGKYFYSMTDQNLTNGKANVYFTKSNSSTMDLQFTFDIKEAYSTFGFCKDIPTYNKVETRVINGSITPSDTRIDDGDSKTISYQPSDDSYYLKRITVDGQDIDTLTDYSNSYTFSNITSDHSIEVEYDKKYTVTFDSKGGTEIDPDYVIPGEKATKPANPTKNGNTFNGWFEDEDCTTPYDFTQPVNEDKILYAKWNQSEDPQPEDPQPEDPQPSSTAAYKVNHYLEDSDGNIEKNGKKYKLDATDAKTGTIDATVTESSKTYKGYKPEKDSLSGKVVEDGSLELDFYYNKAQYTITFDSKGGTEVDKQTKGYYEKVDKPEDPKKEGYTFWYWYEELDGEKKIYDFNTPVTEDKTLIAEWKENKVVPDNKGNTTKKDTTTNTIPMGKTDTTVATKILPNTGMVGTTIIVVVTLLGVFFGIRFLKLRKDMK